MKSKKAKKIEGGKGRVLSFVVLLAVLGLVTVVGCASGAAPPGERTWEQNATAGFPFEEAHHVVVSSYGLRLAPLSFGDLILDGSVARLEGEHYYDRVELKNGSILYVGGNLKIIANRILVDSSSRIIADGRGFLGGGSGKSGCGLGSGIKGSTGSGGGGAGYGADGGAGGNNNCSGGSSYGNETSLSLSMGSGGGGGGAGSGDFGGASGGAGGNGGGEIWLEANSVNIAGTVSANGDHGLSGSDCLGEQAGGGGGGGSGGGILIRGREVEVSEAKLTAKGGDGGTGGSVVTGGTAGSGGGGGAGGRIKIFYENGSGIEPYSGNVEGGKPPGSSSEKNGTKGGEGTLYEEEIDYYESFITHHPSGYFVSKVHDTKMKETCYGRMSWNATVAEGQKITMKVRTSLFPDTEGNATPWEKCVAVSNGENISSLPSVINALPYIQYRAELETDDPATTPVLHWVKIEYYYSEPPIIVANSSGRIKFKSSYIYYPNQEIVYEHGAVIQSQRNGAVMLLPYNRYCLPGVNITKENQTVVEISMTDLAGRNFSYAGSTTISVKNSFNNSALLSEKDNVLPNLTLTLSTEYPALWERRFKRVLNESDINTSLYKIDSTPSAVKVDFYGRRKGVKLRLEKTTIDVSI